MKIILKNVFNFSKQKQSVYYPHDLIIALRLATLGITLGSVSILTSINSINKVHAISLNLVIALLFSFTLIGALSIVKKANSLLVRLLGLVSDAVLITTLIYISDSSVLVILYLPLILLISFIFGRAYSSIYGIVCVFLNLSLTLSVKYNLLPPFILGNNLIAQINLWHFVSLASSFILSSIIPAFFRDKYFKDIDMTSMALSKITTERNIMFEDTPTGIILIKDGKIKEINQTALKILKKTKSELIDKDIKKTWYELTKHSLGKLNQSTNFEVDYCDLMSKENIFLFVSWKRNFSETDITDKQISQNYPELSGAFIIQDLSKLKILEKKLKIKEDYDILETNISTFNEDDRGSFSKVDTGDYIFKSPEMLKILDLVGKLATSNSTALITGESGSGKEIIASIIHKNSDRANNNFVAVNCGAIPSELIEAQLFGYKKGSFTGAIADHNGYFVQANHGTLFLDEIGELPLNMQAKLLRAIQERKIRPLGSEKDISVDIRLLAATNKNLEEEIKLKQFREDLYYRINVVNIKIPPLRERIEDIPLLVKLKIQKLSEKHLTKPEISPEALMALCKYSFPGNIRELENIIERAFVLSSESITEENLNLPIYSNNLSQLNDQSYKDYFSSKNYTLSNSEPSAIGENLINLPTSLDSILLSIEKKYLLAALKQANGSKKKAAELLGINFRSIRYRLSKIETEITSSSN